MLFLTFFIAFTISLIFLFCRNGTRNPNQNNSQNNPNQQGGATIDQKVDKYTNLKTFLEKSFAKKRDQKSKPKLSVTLNTLLFDSDHKEIKRQFSLETIFYRFSLNFDVFCFYMFESEDFNRETLTPHFEKIKSIIGSHRLMTCKTKEGLYAMIRQLNAKFHLESNLNVISNLKSILNNFLFYSEKIEDQKTALYENQKNNIEIFDNLEDLFKRLDNHYLN